MTNFILFNANVKYTGPKVDSLLASLIEIPLQNVVNNDSIAHHAKLTIELGHFVGKVVKSVVHEICKQGSETCMISLDSQKSEMSLPSPNLTTPYLDVIARLLYQNYGIEIKYVDRAVSPRKMVVTWCKGHPGLSSLPAHVNAFAHHTTPSCALKLKGSVSEIPAILIATKSRYFHQMFETQFAKVDKTIVPKDDNIDQASWDLLIDYLREKPEPEMLSIYQIDDLTRLARYFGLPYLEQCSLERLENVTADDFSLALALADKYEDQELKDALIHSEKLKGMTLNLESVPFSKKNFQERFRSEIEAIENHITVDTHFSDPTLYDAPEGLLVEYFKSGDFKGANPPPFVARVQYLIKILHIALKEQSVELLEGCIDCMKKISLHPHYNAPLMVLLDCLILSHYCSSQLSWLKQQTNLMQTFKDQLIKHIVNQIPVGDGAWLWKIACVHQIPELKKACIQPILIPEIEKICSEPSIYGKGDLNDFKLLFQYISESQSSELTAAARGLLWKKPLGNITIKFPLEWGVLNDWLKYAYEKLVHEKPSSPVGFSFLLETFVGQIADMAARLVESEDRLSLYIQDQGKFLTEWCAFAKHHRIHRLIEGCEKAIVGAIMAMHNLKHIEATQNH